MSKPAPLPVPHIVRLAPPTGPGWQVRVPGRITGGRPLTKYFGDSAFESEERALAAAIAFRDECFAGEELIPLERSFDRRNTTGTIGVSFVTRTRYGRLYHYWVAHWSEGKRKRHKAFCVETLGDRPAYEKALAMRKSALARKRRAAGAVKGPA